MGNAIPRRASNTKRKATRERSYLRGQERKAARREANAKAAEHNKMLRAESDIPPAVDLFRKGGTKRRRVADRPLPLRKGNASRTVTIRVMRNQKQDPYGWSVSCLNCPFHKVFLWEHGFAPIFLNGAMLFDIAYEAAFDRATEHFCTPSQWVFSEDNYPTPRRNSITSHHARLDTKGARTGRMAKRNV